MLIAVVILLAVVIAMFAISPFWINWLWFGSMGYRSMLVTNYLYATTFFLGGGLIAAIVFVANVTLALRATRDRQQPREGWLGRTSQWVIRALAFLGGAVMFVIGGLVASHDWKTTLLAFTGGDFGIDDPTFHRDAGFYIFRLPILHEIHNYLFLLAGITLVATAGVYAIRLGARFRHIGDVPWVAMRHLSALGCVMLLIVAAGYWLSNYDLVFSTRGVVVGPGFTDVNVVRPLNWLMAALSAGAGIALLFSVVLRTPKWLIGLLGGWAILAFVVTPLLPVGVQRFLVEPNEFSREQKYIERNLEMTRAGFGLDQVVTQSVTGQDEIVSSELSVDEAPMSNVRIWDYRVVQPIYQQLQTFVPYYEFGDIDVDHYTINGQQVEVLISTRELNVDGLPENSQTWTNVHLAYTHGYGVVMSPVSQVTADGWPTFLVSNIPPTGPDELAITQPEIYFGELPLDWIVIHTDQQEFTGIVADGEATATTTYTGDAKGSISLGNPVTRLMAALTYGDRNLFISGQLNGDSRIVTDRSIVDRAERIAPFLTYDDDPYLVVADGKLYWVIDAYTTSGNFPQATEFSGVSYMRNSAKVVIDAYDGTTTFYRTGVADPIADAWGEVYDDLFTPISEAPESISSHFRYPEDQFTMQSRVWASYHVDSARSLYDGDDRWTIAEESFTGEQQPIEPYYVTLALPGETETSFALTAPFTPGGSTNRQNMTAWFAGTSDPQGNTTLNLYRYPRQITVYGPQQIEARISQDPQISQQLSLWNQSGSDVIRGNLLVVPVNDAMLYVQPIYLQAVSSGAGSPRLAAIIVATKDKVVMRSNLGDAISALGNPNAASVSNVADADEITGDTTTTDTGETATLPGESSGTTTVNTTPVDGDLAAQALDAYNDAQTALTNGDWAAYGEAQARLGEILEAMGAASATPSADPAATPTP